eukprot:TRINITY_DN49806_c0_g1_i1.p1 TRINITY_DN49806_c0_g1~~TRINITY_DN49806_c0_g1_i1.p1  ORF type:complete len:320 (-),score=52.58 TRINITY_DN49806_c0_g1_i1:49-978(-)
MQTRNLMIETDESRHQTLQKSLSVRDKGGPHEQMRSFPARLRFTRSCEILHSSLEEPLAHWKSLEPMKPRWPSTWRRLHLNDGIRVRDGDTIVVSARDSLEKTKTGGLLRSSSGTVTYSSSQRTKLELDVTFLAQILGDGVPHGKHYWTPHRLEHEFVHRTGRPGVWCHYDVGIVAFMLLFPKTFELFGPNHEQVRLKRKVSTTVLDNVEDALVRLARGRENGKIEHHLDLTSSPNCFSQTNKWAGEQLSSMGFQDSRVKPVALPDLQKHRFKATFRSTADSNENTWRRTKQTEDMNMTGFGQMTFGQR